VTCCRAMQQGGLTVAEGCRVYWPPPSRTCHSSAQIKQHLTSTLVSNTPCWHTANIHASVGTRRWWQGGFHATLQVIPPTTCCNINPISFLSCSIRLLFFTFFFFSASVKFYPPHVSSFFHQWLPCVHPWL
jgi:hypothetical protein